MNSDTDSECLLSFRYKIESVVEIKLESSTLEPDELEVDDNCGWNVQVHRLPNS